MSTLKEKPAESAADANLPVSADADVVVCGGGPAGIGAAAMAARGGARTLLIERLGHLGGNGTGAGVVNWGDGYGPPLFRELFERLAAAGAARGTLGAGFAKRPGLDSEDAKAVTLQLVREAGAEILFLTFVEGVWTARGEIRGVVVVNKSGRSRVQAKVVIDASADGDVAANAGAAFQKGDPADGRLQHCNFRYWIEEIDRETFRREKPSNPDLIKVFQQAAAEGEIDVPSHLFQPQAETFPYNSRYEDFWITNWDLERLDPTDAVAMSRMLAECQVAAWKLVQFCRKVLPGYANCRIRKFPDFLGTRESRRIVGRYLLTREDVIRARKFPDGIARSYFYIDLHDSYPGTSIPHLREFVKANGPPEGDYVEIPYRCLLPKGVPGLLVAGRCISADRDAHGSARLMTTAMGTGAAAGAAAALAVKEGVPPDRIDGARLKKLVPG